MINKKELKEIINDLIEVCESTKANISDEVILKEACTYQRQLIITQNKEKKINQEDKPTEKQINTLKKYKVQIPNTKKEATNLIKKLFDKRPIKEVEY